MDKVKVLIYMITSLTMIGIVSGTDIFTCDDFIAINTDPEGSYSLKADVSCSTEDFSSNKTIIPYFSGTLDGMGHTFSDVYINQTDSSDMGIFGVLENASIKRLIFENITIATLTSLGSQGDTLGIVTASIVGGESVMEDIAVRDSVLQGRLVMGMFTGYVTSGGSLDIKRFYVKDSDYVLTNLTGTYSSSSIGFAFGFGSSNVISAEEGYVTGTFFPSDNLRRPSFGDKGIPHIQPKDFIQDSGVFNRVYADNVLNDTTEASYSMMTDPSSWIWANFSSSDWRFGSGALPVFSWEGSIVYADVSGCQNGNLTNNSIYHPIDNFQVTQDFCFFSYTAVNVTMDCQGNTIDINDYNYFFYPHYGQIGQPNPDVGDVHFRMIDCVFTDSTINEKAFIIYNVTSDVYLEARGNIFNQSGVEYDYHHGNVLTNISRNIFDYSYIQIGTGPSSGGFFIEDNKFIDSLIILNNADGAFFGNNNFTNPKRNPLFQFFNQNERLEFDGNIFDIFGNISCLGDCDATPSSFNALSSNNYKTIAFENIEDSLIHDNIFRNISGDVRFLNGAINNSIYNNTFKNLGALILRQSSSYNKVFDNTIISVRNTDYGYGSFNGIQARDSSYNEIHDNIISGSMFGGIVVRGTASYNSIRDNNLSILSDTAYFNLYNVDGFLASKITLLWGRANGIGNNFTSNIGSFSGNSSKYEIYDDSTGINRYTLNVLSGGDNSTDTIGNDIFYCNTLSSPLYGNTDSCPASPNNETPVCTGLVNQSVLNDTEVNISVSCSDPDGMMNFSISCPPLLSFSQNFSNVTPYTNLFTFNLTQNVSCSAYACDSHSSPLCSDYDFSLEVYTIPPDTNDEAPSCSGIQGEEELQNTTLSFSIICNDPDGIANFSLSCSPLYSYQNTSFANTTSFSHGASFGLTSSVNCLLKSCDLHDSPLCFESVYPMVSELPPQEDAFEYGVCPETLVSGLFLMFIISIGIVMMISGFIFKMMPLSFFGSLILMFGSFYIVGCSTPVGIIMIGLSIVTLTMSLFTKT